MHLQSSFLPLESMCTLTLACKHVLTDARWPCLGCTYTNKQSGPSNWSQTEKQKCIFFFFALSSNYKHVAGTKAFQRSMALFVFLLTADFYCILDQRLDTKSPSSWCLNTSQAHQLKVQLRRHNVSSSCTFSRWSIPVFPESSLFTPTRVFGINDFRMQFVCSDQCWMKCRFTQWQ